MKTALGIFQLSFNYFTASVSSALRMHFSKELRMDML